MALAPHRWPRGQGFSQRGRGFSRLAGAAMAATAFGVVGVGRIFLGL